MVYEDVSNLSDLKFIYHADFHDFHGERTCLRWELYSDSLNSCFAYLIIHKVGYFHNI